MTAEVVSVTVTIPTMLAQLIGGARRHQVAASTVAGAVAALISEQRLLGVHIIDESGDVRRHVRVFHNDVGPASLDTTLTQGDTVTIIQAVSGG